MVEYYERLGYLPSGILNALSRLGWSLDGTTEFLSLEDVIQNFTLERIVKAPAGFDPEKLQSYQQYWMNQLPLDDKIAGCLPFLVHAKFVSGDVSDLTRSLVGQVILAVADRLRVFSDILDYKEFFVDDDLMTFDEKPFQQRLRDAPEAVGLLKAVREQLATVAPFDASTLDKLVHHFVETNGIKIGQIVHALRVAVTGKSVGVGLFDALAILGRDRSLRRIDRALNRV